MQITQNKETRYFLEIDSSSLTIIRHGYGQKKDLDGGKQNKPELHRLFITKGQYNKFVKRYSSKLSLSQ